MYVLRRLTISLTSLAVATITTTITTTTNIIITTSTQLGDGLVVNGRAYQLRVLRSSPGTCWPLIFSNTVEWPKITHMLP